jgi:hypothetical protein
MEGAPRPIRSECFSYESEKQGSLLLIRVTCLSCALTHLGSAAEITDWTRTHECASASIAAK